MTSSSGSDADLFTSLTLTCSICLDLFEGDPRVLSCGHTNCTRCLEQLQPAVGTRTIKCPQCQRPSSLPVAQLPVNFIAKQLAELRKAGEAEQKRKEREQKPNPFNESWNVKEVEGILEFGNNGVVTAKGSGGSVRGLKSLPSTKGHKIVYFELKIIYIPYGCKLLIGISQKANANSSFYVFKYFYKLENKCNTADYKGHVIGCGVKIFAGKLFVTDNGAVKVKTKLKVGDGVDKKLTVMLQGDGCCVQLGRIGMSDF